MNKYKRIQFSDHEIEEEIKDEVRRICQRGLTKVDEAMEINQLYMERKQEKKKKKMLEKQKTAKPRIGHTFKKDISDEEEGEIHEQKAVKREQQNLFEGVPSISNLKDHIRPLTLTRNRICDLLNSRRFDKLVKGCFVRYPSDSNTSSNPYIIAQIVGVSEAPEEYEVDNSNKMKTKVLLKLQESSQNVLTLSIKMISNKHPTGTLQIEKWLHSNRNRIPKEKELKAKLEEHNKLLIEELSSEEIDSKIYKKAKKIAEQVEEPKEDITNLIDFMGDKLHNLQLQIEECQIGRKETKTDQKALSRQRQQVKYILDKLKQRREKYLLQLGTEKKAEVPREKKTSWALVQEKRKDAIQEKVKAKNILMSTYQGYNRLKNELIHRNQAFTVHLE